MGEKVVVGSAEINVEISGGGTPVVLVHGLGLSGALWNRMRAELDGSHLLVAVDLRSAGASREEVQEPLSLERWAEDLRVLFGKLGLVRPIVVGHSLGAVIALKLALEHPEAVGGLVLIGAEADLGNLGPRMSLSAERIEAMGMQAWVEEFWSKAPPFAESSLARDSSMLDEYRDLLLANDPVDYVRQCHAIASAEPLGARVAEVAVPTLVIVGGRDDRTLPEHGRAMAQAIPGAELVELPEAGHSIPLEAPAETARAVSAFVDALAARAAEAGGGARVLRSDTTPRNPTEGPFGHLDVRWVVGPNTGATLISFGQSTYPFGATHENHHHPNAEEVVMVVSGRGTQIVGRNALDVGPGDICFIPRKTPHRITGTSESEPLVILWAFGGAAGMEEAGYVPLPDDTEEVP
ncbi:MAG: alpha/beta fold hydrolase [Gaiellales bacterium]